MRWGDADDDGMLLWSFMVIYIYIYTHACTILPRMNVLQLLSQICQPLKNHMTLCDKSNLQTMDSAQRQGPGRILLLVAGSQTTLWKGSINCKCTVSLFSANWVIVSYLIQPTIGYQTESPTDGNQGRPCVYVKGLAKGVRVAGLMLQAGYIWGSETVVAAPTKGWTHWWREHLLTFIFKTQNFCFKGLKRLDVFCKFQF